FIANIALALIDYQFKAGARQHYTVHELAGFFGNFYAYTSIVALFIQLFLVHQILNKGGIKLGLCLLPIGILVGSIGTLITAQFSWILGTKAIVQVFLFTIDIAALQMLYMGIPIASRNQARAFADGITKPIAIATAGIGLIGLAQLLPLHLLAIGGAILSILWLLLVHTNSKAYVSALIDSLGTKQFDLTQETAQFQDITVASYVREALQTSPDGDIIYLLNMTQDIPQIDWTEEYRHLINKESPEIKILAIRHLKEKGNQTDANTLIPLLEHTNSKVRSEAIRALSTLGSPDIISNLTPYLHDPDLRVQAATIASLVNAGDLDQLIDAGIALRQLLNADKTSHRVAAAHALADIKDSVLHRAYIGLLQDPKPEVQQAALTSCRAHPDPKLVPILIPLLSNPEIGLTVADVLAGFGHSVRDKLVPLLIHKNNETAFSGV
ncbi:MAG: HEAT repeat domain-containing protein, partial [Candidatus Latescibacterota bacterium]